MMSVMAVKEMMVPHILLSLYYNMPGDDLHPLSGRRLYEISCVSQVVCILFQVQKK